MKQGILLISALLMATTANAEFYDPMRPPAFALEKFRQAKQKQKAQIKKPVKTVKKATPLVLHSILYSSQRQHAIINNKVMKKGDVIEGAKLIRLNPRSVRLISKGKVIDLNLNHRFKSIRKSLNEKKI